MATRPKTKMARNSPITGAGSPRMHKSVTSQPEHSDAHHTQADILSLGYQSAMIKRVADGERVPLNTLSGADIPQAVLRAIAAERAESLGGVHGDPSWGQPIQ